MNKESQIVSLRTAETIENEATDWLTRLDGGYLSASDRRALKEWLARDPEHARVLKSVASLWCEMDFLLNEFPELNKTESPGLLSLLLRTEYLPTALATALLCVVALFVWIENQPVPTEIAFLATGVGEQRVESFRDGSSAHLNTDSMVEVEYTESMRIVRLLRGEAMFDVTHDPARPFIVYAGDNEVKAVGTRFAVRITSENILVTVSDGKVQLSKRKKVNRSAEVEKEQEAILVSEGEELEISDKAPKAELKKIHSDELQRRLAWTEGQLVFKSERLAQVIEEVSRYVPDRIIIDDPELSELRISGRFLIGDTEALLEAIEVSLNVQANHVDEKVIRLSR